MNSRQKKKMKSLDDSYAKWYGDWMGFQIDCSMKKIKGISLPSSVKTLKVGGLDVYVEHGI